MLVVGGFEIDFDGLVLLLGIGIDVRIHFFFGDGFALKVVFFFPEFEFVDDVGNFFFIEFGVEFVVDFGVSVRLIVGFLVVLEVGAADVFGFGVEAGEFDGVGFFVELEGLGPFGVIVDIFMHVVCR